MGRRNKNRGYQRLTVWQAAIELYTVTWEIFRRFPYHLNRVSAQAIGSVDSVHRNIAEGYCRRSINEYLRFLYIALSSLGESVFGFIAGRRAGQLSDEDFEKLDALAFKIENGMLRLIESLERKRTSGDWIDTLMVKESNVAYGKGQESELE
ncbi:MAG: four helix bundle protein [bacterium]